MKLIKMYANYIMILGIYYILYIPYYNFLLNKKYTHELTTLSHNLILLLVEIIFLIPKDVVKISQNK